MVHEFRPNRQIRRCTAAIAYLVEDSSFWLDALPANDHHIYYAWIQRLILEQSYRLDRARARYARRYNLDWFEGVPASHA